LSNDLAGDFVGSSEGSVYVSHRCRQARQPSRHEQAHANDRDENADVFFKASDANSLVGIQKGKTLQDR